MNAIRWYDPQLVFEATARTVDGKFWFDPETDPDIAQKLHAIFARAQVKYKVRIFAYCVMSNHYHALYGADDPDSLADFLNHVHGAMARYVNRQFKRSGPVLAGRCHVRPVLADESAQVSRLQYIMGQAVKAKAGVGITGGPGANTNAALMFGEAPEGAFFDQHRHTLDKRLKSGPKADSHYVSRHLVELTPLPCWAHLGSAERLAKYRAAAAAADEKFRVGVQPTATAQETPPEASEDSAEPAPPSPGSPVRAKELPKKQRKRALLCHAGTRAQADAYAAQYKRICAQYEEARIALREQAERALRGKRAKAVLFPVYTFASPPRTGRLRRELAAAGKLAPNAERHGQPPKWG